MRYSSYFLKTSKEKPSEETAKNAELLIQGGFIKKELAGVYSFLPLGLRVLKKIKKIVAEEMEKSGAIECLMSEISPQKNWEKTGRSKMDVLFSLDLAAKSKAFLCATHEELVTPMVKNFCSSHKDFPLFLYHVQTKFRNEPRAKSGLLRCREFLMKDAYSFHTSREDFEEFYNLQKKVYKKIFDRLGLGDLTVMTAASGGDFSEFSHEFQTKSEIGEDEIFYVKSVDKYFNKEIAPSKICNKNQEDEILPKEEIYGENIIGVDALINFLKIPIEKTTKTLFYETDSKKIIAVALRGDYQINENKLKKISKQKNLKLASAETIKKITGAEPGYAGILNLPSDIQIFMDDSMQGRKNFEMGINHTGYHAINVNFGRDLVAPEKFYDIKIAKKNDLYPETNEKYEVFNAIEVGNIFPLEAKYSDAFSLKFVDTDGKEKSVIMGCYGIGITRLMGVLAEIFSDQKGLIWPKNIAPFQIYLAPIGRSDEVYSEAEKIYEQLNAQGIEVFFDDRREKKISPGQKFSDHELLGIPYRIVLSEKLLEEKKLEIVDRKTLEKEIIFQKDLEERLKKMKIFLTTAE